MKAIRIGTRGSRLALAQARLAGEAVAPALSGRPVEIVPIRTRGDRLDGPLTAVGGKGLFTAELEAALREGKLDLAVHSAKDLPAEMTDDLTIAAVLPRADVRDALVSRGKRGQVSFCRSKRGKEDKKAPDPFSFLPVGAKVGTSSLRRSALLRSARPDAEISHLRGNVDTRIQKVLGEKADFDATVLATAGLERGGWLAELSEFVHPLPADTFLPAAGQGTLVLQTRANDSELIESLRGVNHVETLQALQAERSVLRRLGASCHSCLSVHVFAESGFWRARGMVARSDGSDMLRAEAQESSAQQAADALANTLLAAGANERLKKQ